MTDGLETVVCAEVSPAAGAESVWANSSALRVSVLGWSSLCAVRLWRLALRPAGADLWTRMPTDGEYAEVPASLTKCLF